MFTSENSKLSNDQLRADLADGLKAPEIARKHGLTPQNIAYRIRRIKSAQIQAVVHVPTETRRYVASQIDIMMMLAKSVGRLEKLQDACHKELTDPDNPDEYDLGPRANEIDVIYLSPPDEKGKRVKLKKKLSELIKISMGGELEFVSAETKVADRRELIVKTMVETRMTAQAVLEAADRIANQQALDKLRDALLQLYQRYEPELGAKLAREVNEVGKILIG